MKNFCSHHPTRCLGDESSDSGSQVIALDDSSAFESDSDLGMGDAAEPMLVPDEQDALDVQLEPIDSAAAVAGAMLPAGHEAPEADYTAWNIMALLFVVLLAVGHRHADGRRGPEHVVVERRSFRHQWDGEQHCRDVQLSSAARLQKWVSGGPPLMILCYPRALPLPRLPSAIADRHNGPAGRLFHDRLDAL